MRPSVNHTPVSGDLVRNTQTEAKVYMAKLKSRSEKLDSEMASLRLSKISCQTAAEARRLKEKAIDKANNDHKRKALKRKLSSAGSTQTHKKRC